jgi:hypothetical protein
MKGGMNRTSKLPQSFRKPCRTGTRHLGGVALALVLGHIQLALAQDPIITLQPTNQTVFVGGNVMMSVQATTTNGPPTYQWQRDDPTVPVTFTNIPNATRVRLDLRNVTLEAAGDYRAIVGNASGDTVTSDVAHLEVIMPLFTRITEGPIVNDALDTWDAYWGDYDNDGRLDVLVTGNIGQWRLYHNDGGTSFSTVTSGVMGEYNVRSMYGLWSDLDNDGDLDLFGWTRPSTISTMFWNDGSGVFTRDVGWLPGIDLTSVGRIISMGDFDNDGFIDAFLGAVDDPDSNALLRNNGDCTFTVVPGSVLNFVGDRGFQNGCAVDYDNDGDLDIVLVHFQSRPTAFYRNDGGFTFTEATPEPIRSEVTYSLIAAWADFDNDGDLDVIFGGWNWLSERFYLNHGDGTFTRWAGQPALLESNTDSYGSYHNWGDFDNDGYLDLVVSKGNSAVRLWRNQGDGNFAAVDAGDLTRESGTFVQSCTWVDFNEDGNLDLFVCTLNGGKDKLFMGNGNGNRWLEVKPKGVVSNRLAVGARIFATATIRGQVMRQMRVITADTADQTLVAHFGLGDAAQVDLLRIEWPSGIVQEIANVPANQVLPVTEPPRLIPQGVGKFQIQCWIGQSFGVQCSADLSTWTTVAIVTNTTGTLIFEDVEADEHVCRYYRVVEQIEGWLP